MSTVEEQACPTKLGYRMPAEWEPQEAIWLSWPHRRKTWLTAYDAVPQVFARIASHISDGELVRINVANQEMAEHVKELIRAEAGHLENVRFHFNATNDAWVRDHGPIYVVRDELGERVRAVTNWNYNSWGGKYPPFDLDNDIPSRIADELGEQMFKMDMVLEGGSIDVNGTGTLLTTRSCLLNPNRNPHRTQAEIEQSLMDSLGVQKVLWLGDGIVGDDTDGHVDDITRFVSPTKIVTAYEDNPSDVNYAALKANLELLELMTDPSGERFEILKLPMPAPVYANGSRLPASYANFLICNHKVLVPIYGCVADETALEILQHCFADREVIGINCTDLVWGLGAIHCVTQQQPAVGVTHSVT